MSAVSLYQQCPIIQRLQLSKAEWSIDPDASDAVQLDGFSVLHRQRAGLHRRREITRHKDLIDEPGLDDLEHAMQLEDNHDLRLKVPCLTVAFCFLRFFNYFPGLASSY